MSTEDSGSKIPDIVTLRDIYKLSNDTKDRVTAISVEVRNLREDRSEQRKENRRIWSAIHAIRMRMYMMVGGMAVVTFIIVNWSSIRDMME